MIAIMRIIDAVDCIKKYLMAASVERGFVFFIRIGMKASMFISRPTQSYTKFTHQSTSISS